MLYRMRKNVPLSRNNLITVLCTVLIKHQKGAIEIYTCTLTFGISLSVSYWTISYRKIIIQSCAYCNAKHGRFKTNFLHKIKDIRFYLILQVRHFEMICLRCKNLGTCRWTLGACLQHKWQFEHGCLIQQKRFVVELHHRWLMN